MEFRVQNCKDKTIDSVEVAAVEASYAVEVVKAAAAAEEEEEACPLTNIDCEHDTGRVVNEK